MCGGRLVGKIYDTGLVVRWEIVALEGIDLWDWEREIEAEESPTASTIVRRRQNMCLYLEEEGGGEEGEEEVDKMSISVSRYIYFSYC